MDEDGQQQAVADRNPDRKSDADGGNGRGLRGSVLVLNRYYMPVHIANAKRAVDLLYKESAESIDAEGASYQGYLFEDWVSACMAGRVESINGDWVRTVSMRFRVPRVIRLLRYSSMPKWEVKFNRRNIILRDRLKCQYCGKKISIEEATLDHVIPRTDGGKTTWDNVVLACSRCNTKKGGRRPAAAGMRLIKRPSKPKFSPLIYHKYRDEEYRVWKKFIPK